MRKLLVASLIIALTFFAILLPGVLIAADPSGSGNTFQRTYGGTGDDYASSVQQTSDGGYIVAGKTNSFGAGSDDFWVLKLNSAGTIQWQKTYGGTGIDRARSVQQTSDGGYIVAGETLSFGAGGTDFWVLKLTSTGSVTWQKTYGGTGGDHASSVQQTKDGGYIVAGSTNSFGAGIDDFWVLKLTSTGSVTWQKTYGGTNSDDVTSVQQTSDGGYIVAGVTTSFGAGSNDAWVLKLDSGGSISDACSLGVSSTGTTASASTGGPATTTVTPTTSTATPASTSVTGTAATGVTLTVLTVLFC